MSKKSDVRKWTKAVLAIAIAAIVVMAVLPRGERTARGGVVCESTYAQQILAEKPAYPWSAAQLVYEGGCRRPAVRAMQGTFLIGLFAVLTVSGVENYVKVLRTKKKVDSRPAEVTE